MQTVTIGPEDPDQLDIHAMFEQSDAYMSALYPADSNHMVDVAALQAPNARFLVARRDGECLGCGAVVIADNETAEIKRMWVDPGARGLKLGQQILAALERIAHDEGVHVLRLETGVSQVEAINLYRSAGYSEIGPFGTYQPDPLSMFMEKSLEKVR